MTAVQTARTAGIRAQLAKRGVILTLNSVQYTALIDTEALKEGDFAYAKEERSTDQVCILRVDIGAAEIGTGATFVEADTGAQYRVTEVIDKPVDVLVRFVCESIPG